MRGDDHVEASDLARRGTSICEAPVAEHHAAAQRVQHQRRGARGRVASTSRRVEYSERLRERMHGRRPASRAARGARALAGASGAAGPATVFARLAGARGGLRPHERRTGADAATASKDQPSRTRSSPTPATWPTWSPLEEAHVTATHTLVVENRTTLKLRKCRLVVTGGPDAGR